MARKDNRASHSKTNSNNAPITPRPSHDNHASRNDSSPPRTPPSQIDRVPRNKKGGGNAAGGAKAARNRPSLREAFGDQATDSPDRYHDPHERSSHDLSWSPRDTRDSVVDNMLLSLDQFSAGPLTSHSTTTTQTYSTESAFVQGQPFTISSSGRPRGHTVSSSMSSSYSIPFESPQTVQTRGHRSNSSTNFQTSLGRIDSVRLATDDKARIANAGQESGSGTVKAGGGAHARKSSKNSGSSSMDFGQMGGPRWQRAAARRSSSFDHGYNRPLITATTTAPVLTTYGNTHDDFDYDSLEAAPTPTVPVGPRRNHSPPPSTFRPASSVSASQTIPIRRRGSIRSPMSFLRSDQSESRKAPRGHGRTNSRDQKINSVISPHTPDKAPAPSNQVHASAAPKEKERPGFFKRVFGSSRTNAIPSPIDSRHSKGTNGSSENSTRSGSKVDGVNTTPSTKPARSMVGSPPATGNKPQAKEHPHPPLNKKSSFFRRRRKNSVSEQPAPEVPQIQALWRDVPPLNPPPSADGNIDSPSSLRKVMHPYLDSPTRIDSGTYAEPEQPKDTTSRSGNYNQSTIRAVRPVDDSDIIELPSLRDTTNTYRTNQGETTHNRTESAQEPNSKPQQVSAPHKDKSRPKSDENEPPTTHKSHLRTQSDIDKELPRLPTLNQRPIEARETSGLAQKLQTPPVRTSSREHSNSIDSAIAQKYAQKGGDDSDPRPRLRLNPSDAKSANAAVRLSPTADKSEDPRTSGSTLSDYKSANSKVQSPISPHGESLDIMPSEADLKAGLPEILESPVANLTLEEDAMSVEDKEAARRLFHGEGDIGRGDIASWLGEAGPERATIRKAYMEHFDWQSMSILAALRGFCAHLKLKGETQQVDRLLDAISTRWCNCNPNHGFKATGRSSYISAAFDNANY